MSNELTQAEMLQSGNSLIKIENTELMSMAIQNKRDELFILTDALTELTRYKSMAETAIYRKPVGKDDKGNQTYAEGLSIKAAESLARRWGNCAVACEKVAEDDTQAVIRAIFLDYESNYRFELINTVSKTYKKRDGSTGVWWGDRFDIVIKAAQSKLLREVILRSLPAGLKQEYEERVREILSSQDSKEVVGKIVKAFRGIGIEGLALTGFMGKSLDELTQEEIINLRALYNGVKEGEIDKAELFEKSYSNVGDFIKMPKEKD